MSKSDLWLKILLIALSAIFWAFIGFGIWKGNYHRSEPESPNFNSQNSKYLAPKSGLVIIGENTLKAVSPVYFPRVQVLGTLMVNNLTREEVKGLDKLWFCESSRRHTGVWGDKGKSYGAFQFQQPTWDLFCEGSRDNFDDQVRCAKKMIDMGLGGKTIGWYNCFKKFNLCEIFPYGCSKR